MALNALERHKNGRYQENRKMRRKDEKSKGEAFYKAKSGHEQRILGGKIKIDKCDSPKEFFHLEYLLFSKENDITKQKEEPWDFLIN